MARKKLAYPGDDGKLGTANGSAISDDLKWGHNIPTRQFIVVPAPGAGSEWLYKVPADTWLRIGSGFGTFSTDGTVATRQLGWQLLDEADVVASRYTAGGAGYAANVLNGFHSYTQASGWSQSENFVPGTTQDTLSMPSIVLCPGWSLGSYTINLKPGDSYSAIRFHVLRWTSAPVMSCVGVNL